AKIASHPICRQSASASGNEHRIDHRLEPVDVVVHRFAEFDERCRMPAARMAEAFHEAIAEGLFLLNVQGCTPRDVYVALPSSTLFAQSILRSVNRRSRFRR